MNSNFQNSMKPNTSLESRLQDVRRRIRRVQATRAALVIATIALGGLFVVMATDYFLGPLPTAARWVLTGGWLVAVGVAARSGTRPLRTPVSLLQVARWLETRHPEMEERLSTALELESASGGVSASLVELLARSAEADVRNVDGVAEIKAARTTRRWARPAMAMTAILLLALAAWPGATGRLLARAVMPFSKIGNAEAGKFTVKPGNTEVLEGDAVEIDVAYSGCAKSVELWMEREDGTEISQAMTPVTGHFRYRLDPAKTGFGYHVRAGRAESDGYTVKVWPQPRLVDPRATLDFPDYTGEPAREQTPDRGIVAVVGTKITLTARTNTAVASAWIDLNGQRLADGEVENTASTGRVSFSFPLTKGMAGEAVVMLKHRLGQEVEALRFPVQAQDDLAPEVVLLRPSQREMKIRPEEFLPLAYQVTEDFALAAVDLDAEAGGKKSLMALALPERVGGAELRIFRGEGQVAIGELRTRFPGANEIRVRIRAADKRPENVGGPGVGFSEWLTLHIDEGAESLARQELREQHEGAKETIEKAIQSVREARERMDWHREEIKRNDLNDNARKDVKEAGEKLASAGEQLEKLAAQMKEGVHATKANEVQKAAETVAKAREDLENSPLQDEADRRDAKLQAARDESESAVKQLENVRNAMDREREKIEDLARISELAQQQNEQARQANAALDKPNALPEQWQQRQQQIAQQLAQQLRDRPDAKAAALKSQAEQAKALAEQAREIAEAQKSLEQQAKKPTAEALQAALAAEQTKIAAESNAQLADARESRNQMADSLPEATAAAERARDQIQKGDTQSAAAAAQQAAQAMKASAGKSPDAAGEKAQGEQTAEARAKEGSDAQDSHPSDAQAASGEKESAGKSSKSSEQSQQNGDTQAGHKASGEAKAAKTVAQQQAVADLAKKQAQVAAAMAALASGDTAAALQALQESQAEAARELADAMGKVPQIDGNGAMNEAKNAGQQGATEASQAAQQSQKGDAQAAAGQHAQASNDFGKSAAALARAGSEFSQAAQQAAGQTPNPQRAQVSPAALAEAFQQASQASSQPADPSAEAASASAAAKALAEAARAGRQQMQGRQPGQPDPPAPPNGAPSEISDGKLRTAEPDPGVPPELAKLGISAEDWEKIQSSLKSDVGAGQAGQIPEEYRELVKRYFESMSKVPANKRSR
jgi:hypothetical protein